MYVIEPNRKALKQLIQNSKITLQGDRAGKLWTAEPTRPSRPVALIASNLENSHSGNPTNTTDSTEILTEHTAKPVRAKRRATALQRWVWHLRLHHLNPADMAVVFSSEYSPDASIWMPSTPFNCTECRTYKSHAVPRKLLSRAFATRPGECFSFDIHDFVELSWQGERYLWVAVDWYTRKPFNQNMKVKSESVEAYKKLLLRSRARHGIWPLVYFSDAENVLTSKKVQEINVSLGMTEKTSARYRHDQNGIAERVIQTITTSVG